MILSSLFGLNEQIYYVDESERLLSAFFVCLFVYTYTPAASFCFQKTSSDKYTVRCSHRNKCLGDRVSRRSMKQGNWRRHNSSGVRRNEKHIGNGSVLVDISGKCQHRDAIKSVIYVWSQSVKESFWIVPVRLLNKSLVYSSNLRSKNPTTAKWYVSVRGKLEKAVSLLGARQMASHIGRDGKWRRMSHLTVSSWWTYCALPAVGLLCCFVCIIPVFVCPEYHRGGRGGEEISGKQVRS